MIWLPQELAQMKGPKFLYYFFFGKVKEFILCYLMDMQETQKFCWKDILTF